MLQFSSPGLGFIHFDMKKRKFTPIIVIKSDYVKIRSLKWSIELREIIFLIETIDFLIPQSSKHVVKFIQSTEYLEK